MICENCGSEHAGAYGSGRFCGAKCARGFSTKANREDINKKVSKKLRGQLTRGGWTAAHRDPTLRVKIAETKKKRKAERIKNTPWDELSQSDRQARILIEQDHKCLHCGISEWNNAPITLQFDHIDGRRGNNTRENLRALCPNCHSQTPTYSIKNMSENGRERHRKANERRRREVFWSKEKIEFVMTNYKRCEPYSDIASALGVTVGAIKNIIAKNVGAA